MQFTGARYKRPAVDESELQCPRFYTRTDRRVNYPKYMLYVLVPGLTELDIDISITARSLTVTYSDCPDTPSRPPLHCREFEMSFTLDEGVYVDTAIVENGILEVVLKRGAIEPIVITVKGNTPDTTPVCLTEQLDEPAGENVD